MNNAAVIVFSLGIATAAAADQNCQVGVECELRGILSIHRGMSDFTATLRVSSEQRVSLALPGRIYNEWQSWDEQEVSLVGPAYAHNIGEDLLTYEIEGRHVGAWCGASPYSVFVNEISRVR